MNQLLPKYSFIRHLIPHTNNYKHNLYKNIDINYTNYVDRFTLNNLEIKTDIMIKNNTKFETNYDFITSTQFIYKNRSIDENINIFYDKKTYQIKYRLNNIIIDIPKFHIEKNNQKLLLYYYKFIDDDYIDILDSIKKF